MLAGSNGPLLCGKQTTFEGGFRVPTIAWWPTVIKSNSVMSEVSALLSKWPLTFVFLKNPLL